MDKFLDYLAGCIVLLVVLFIPALLIAALAFQLGWGSLILFGISAVVIWAMIRLDGNME